MNATSPLLRRRPTALAHPAGAALLSLTIATACSTSIENTPPGEQRLPATLPIFAVEAAPADTTGIQALGQRILGVTGTPMRRDDRLVIQSGDRVAETFVTSGGVWVADHAVLWNPNLRPSLPDSGQALRIAAGLVQQHGLLPQLQEPFRWDVRHGGTVTASYDRASRARSTHWLDRQVTYAARVRIPDLAQELPVVGGGGEFNVVLGDAGRLIGFSGVWRPVRGVAQQSPVIPRHVMDERYRAMLEGVRLVSMDASLAYYSAPASAVQTHLYPVWVYRAVAEIGGDHVPLRVALLPATEFGPMPRPQRQVPPRMPGQEPQPRPSADDEPPTGAGGGMGGGLRAAGLGGVLSAGTGDGALQNLFEAGTSWIGLSGGLGGSQGNAQGFVDRLSSAGWAINFNWGDGAAWESDWRAHDDTWVDAADFVFYTGHAGLEGWMLSSPEDGSLTFTEVGANSEDPGDLWGQTDLEWLIIAACGPLEDDVLSAGGGDVFDRWDGALDGLHLLMGYGAVTFDTQDEGRTVAQYALDGRRLIDAWFRTAKEIQPDVNGFGPPYGGRVWVGVMYGTRGSANPGGDHLWGRGSVSADPENPTGLVAMWTTT